MTIPKIEHVGGNRNTEYITVVCTGCNEYSSYSVRQYKGDFGCNISEFESFLQWAKCEAAKHECFLAGRMGYMPPTELARHASQPDDPLPPIADEFIFSGDSLGVRAEREAFERTFPGSLDFHPPEREDDPLTDLWMEQDEETDWEDLFDDDDEEECTLDEHLSTINENRSVRKSDTYGWEEVRFDFLYDEHVVVTTITGRIAVRHPDLQDLRERPRLHSFPPIEFDFAALEQRIFDILAEDEGIYTRDAAGNLCDEKGRCLTCIRSHDRRMGLR